MLVAYLLAHLLAAPRIDLVSQAHVAKHATNTSGYGDGEGDGGGSSSLQQQPVQTAAVGGSGDEKPTAAAVGTDNDASSAGVKAAEEVRRLVEATAGRLGPQLSSVLMAALDGSSQGGTTAPP